jgi:hypothetical protein
MKRALEGTFDEKSQTWAPDAFRAESLSPCIPLNLTVQLSISSVRGHGCL